MTNGSNALHFFYDAQNRPAIVVYNGTAYGYVHNLQGDIIAIVDSAGTKVVEYKYDAWGKPLSKTGSLASTLGKWNPFRYRGYVFDEETNLYYLRSRYYNATCFRFVNTDSLIANSVNHTRHNLFAFCADNPVIYSDPDGYEAISMTANAVSSGTGMQLLAAILAAIAEPTFVGEVAIVATLLGGALSLSKANTQVISRVDDETAEKKPRQKTYIYRSASGPPQSLTPRAVDTNGLSFFIYPPNSGKYYRTSIERVNSTGVLMAVPDINNPAHILVVPVMPDTLDEWISSRNTANFKPHPYTLLLMSLRE